MESLTKIDNQLVQSKIYTVRNTQVMLDRDLAQLYGVQTKALNQAVKRNSLRFPERYCFQLTQQEFENLKSQIVTSSGHGGRRTLPYAFTEQGIFFNGQIFDAYVFVADLIKSAKQSITIIDNYLDESVLLMLTKRKSNVKAELYGKNTNKTTRPGATAMADINRIC